MKYHSIPNDFKRGVYCDIVTATCISFTNYIDYEVMTKWQQKFHLAQKIKIFYIARLIVVLIICYYESAC